MDDLIDTFIPIHYSFFLKSATIRKSTKAYRFEINLEKFIFKYYFFRNVFKSQLVLNTKTTLMNKTHVRTTNKDPSTT